MVAIYEDGVRQQSTAGAWLAWSAALAASAASFYFIEIQHRPAAELCWLDRMLMFGLLLIISVGLARRDLGMWRYTIPFLAIGLPVSLFQQLVHWGLIQIAPKACSISYVCTTKYFNLLGFVSQATLCLVGFAVVAVGMWLTARLKQASSL